MKEPTHTQKKPCTNKGTGPCARKATTSSLSHERDLTIPMKKSDIHIVFNRFSNGTEEFYKTKNKKDVTYSHFAQNILIAEAQPSALFMTGVSEAPEMR